MSAFFDVAFGKKYEDYHSDGSDTEINIFPALTEAPSCTFKKRGRSYSHTDVTVNTPTVMNSEHTQVCRCCYMGFTENRFVLLMLLLCILNQVLAKINLILCLEDAKRCKIC